MCPLKAIQDEFFGKGSPQERYTWRHKAKGICVKCVMPATHGNLCEAHWAKSREAQRVWRGKVKAKTVDENPI